jgi:Protein of unknown function (DUF1559)
MPMGSDAGRASDFDRMPSRPWGQNNYRSCNGSSWSGRAGDGIFGQSTRIGPAQVRDGLSNTAAMAERVRGHDDYERLDSDADLFRDAAPWTEEAHDRIHPTRPLGFLA